MRICLISGEFPPMQGGVGDFTQELGSAMVAAGHDVTILTSARSVGAQYRSSCEVFPVVEEWGWSSWALVDSFLAQHPTDIANIQYQTAAYGMKPAINLLPWRLRLKGRGQTRFIVTFHDLLVPYLFRGAGPLRRWVTDALAFGCDGAIVTNEEDAATLQRRGSRIPRRLIPIGSNISARLPDDYDREACRTRWGIGVGQLALSYFGFLNQSKGGEELIEALSLLVASGRDVKLLMVGGKVGSSDSTNLAYLEQVERLIERLGMRDRVIWTDYLPDQEVTAALCASDICVLPYRDGASTRRGTLMAALAHALPIVTTIPQVPVSGFLDGENMLLTKPRDPAALADAIGSLADAPTLRARLSAGAADLSRRFAWPAIARQTLKFYQGLHHDGR